MSFEKVVVSRPRETRGGSREQIFGKLESMVRAVSDRVNGDFRACAGYSESGGNMVDEGCQLNMDTFAGKFGEALEDDKRMVEINEQSFSGATNPLMRERVYGGATIEDSVVQWREKKRREDGSLAEMATILVLHKFLGKRFAVVRTSPYDDYQNSVDLILVDKETGSAVCAFDDLVRSDMTNNAKEAGKIARAKGRLTKKGGMHIKYGFTFVKNASGKSELILGEMPRVPGICISQTHEELRALLQSMPSDIDTPPGVEEQRFFQSILDSMEQQVSSLGENLHVEQRKQMKDFLTSARRI